MTSCVLSIVVPVFNEEDALPILRRRLEDTLAHVGCSWEVVLVDDGSSDRTVELIRTLVQGDPRYRGVLLSRNHGHQLALTAGLDHARGEAVVVIDADLQDPPELIPPMLQRWREGFDVVFGQRISRQSDTFMKRATAYLFYWIVRRLSNVDIPQNVGDFRLMDRKVVDALKRMPERFRFVRGMVAWVGFRQCAIEFERPPRVAGDTKYPWRKMVSFALDAIFAFSVSPLRAAAFIGALTTLGALCVIAWTVYLRFLLQATVPGYSALIVAVLLMGGLNLLMLGIVGEYVGRVYVEVKGRPLYLVRELVTREAEAERV
jgi:dolichol-phosphate mannosyltransferase